MLMRCAVLQLALMPSGRVSFVVQHKFSSTAFFINGIRIVIIEKKKHCINKGSDKDSPKHVLPTWTVPPVAPDPHLGQLHLQLFGMWRLENVSVLWWVFLQIGGDKELRV